MLHAHLRAMRVATSISDTMRVDGSDMPHVTSNVMWTKNVVIATHRSSTGCTRT